MMTAERLSLKDKLDKLHTLVYAAHTRALELTKQGVHGFSESPVGMSHGPFSLINEICAEVAGLETSLASEKARADRAETENKRLMSLNRSMALDALAEIDRDLL